MCLKELNGTAHLETGLATLEMGIHGMFEICGFNQSFDLSGLDPTWFLRYGSARVYAVHAEPCSSSIPSIFSSKSLR